METKLYFCKTFSLRSLIIVDYELFIVSRQARTIVKEQPREKNVMHQTNPLMGIRPAASWLLLSSIGGGGSILSKASD